MRFEFWELLVRIAFEKYKDCGYSASLKRLVEEKVLPSVGGVW